MTTNHFTLIVVNSLTTKKTGNYATSTDPRSDTQFNTFD